MVGWAEEPLWQAYLYFHEWWKTRREDLEKRVRRNTT
jgi:hypothetical protein